MSTEKAKQWNRMPPPPVQQPPRTSWWLSPDGVLPDEARAKAQERMSLTTVTLWQARADGTSD